MTVLTPRPQPTTKSPMGSLRITSRRLLLVALNCCFWAIPLPDVAADPVLEVSFERPRDATEPIYIHVLATNESDQAPLSGLSLDALAPRGTISPVTELGDGLYAAELTPAGSGEHPVTVTEQKSGSITSRVAVVVPGIAPILGQPEQVPGETVSTPGWEDGLCVSPDGGWLVLQYSPMSISGFLVGDPDHPFATTAVGPFAGPERPDFPAARINESGAITNAFPLYGLEAEDLEVTIPPTAQYLFRRQPDGTFGAPRAIYFDDSRDGCLGAFGPCFPTGLAPDHRGAASPPTPFILAFNDPRFDTGPDTGNDVVQLDIDLMTGGGPTILGSYVRTKAGAIVEEFNLSATLGDEIEGDQGNPHLHVGGSFGAASLWTDDEAAANQDLYLTWTDVWPSVGGWSTRGALPSPICLPDAQESQPFFDGERLIFRRGSVLMQSHYLGGDPLAASGEAWSPPVVLLSPGGDAGATDSFLIAGEPSVATDAEGRAMLYFIYGVMRGNGSVDLQAGRVPFRETPLSSGATVR